MPTIRIGTTVILGLTFQNTEMHNDLKDLTSSISNGSKMTLLMFAKSIVMIYSVVSDVGKHHKLRIVKYGSKCKAMQLQPTLAYMP